MTHDDYIRLADGHRAEAGRLRKIADAHTRQAEKYEQKADSHPPCHLCGRRECGH